eukprot:5165568-Amphidinium_carterae.1
MRSGAFSEATTRSKSMLDTPHCQRINKAIFSAIVPMVPPVQGGWNAKNLHDLPIKHTCAQAELARESDESSSQGSLASSPESPPANVRFAERVQYPTA